MPLSVATTELAPTKVDRSTWAIPTYRVPSMLERTIRPVTIGPRTGQTTDIEARRAFYKTPENLEELIAEAAENRSPISALKCQETLTGAPVMSIRQGMAFSGNRGHAYLPVGHRSNGYALTNVIDLITDKGHAPAMELARRWYFETGVPLTTELTKEALSSATEAHPIAAIYTHPGFSDGSDKVPGCVWIITEANDEIADGYLWTPPSHLCSEHGSTYVKDIVGVAALSLTSPKITFADCFNLPTDPKEAYTAIFGN